MSGEPFGAPRVLEGVPLSYFRRPLAVVTVLYAVLIASFKGCGLLREEPPRELLRFSRRPTLVVEGRVISGFSPKRPGERFWLSLARFDGRAQRPVKVLAYLRRADPDTARLRPGMVVRLEGRLRLPQRPRWPGAFDERAFLWLNRAHFVFHAKTVEIADAAVSWRWKPWSFGESIHRSIHRYLLCGCAANKARKAVESAVWMQETGN